MQGGYGVGGIRRGGESRVRSVMHVYGKFMYYESKASLFYVQLIVLKVPIGVLLRFHDPAARCEKKACDEKQCRVKL
jgi:hypothetical protein